MSTRGEYLKLFIYPYCSVIGFSCTVCLHLSPNLHSFPNFGHSFTSSDVLVFGDPCLHLSPNLHSSPYVHFPRVSYDRTVWESWPLQLSGAPEEAARPSACSLSPLRLRPCAPRAWSLWEPLRLAQSENRSRAAVARPRFVDDRFHDERLHKGTCTLSCVNCERIR